MEVDCCCTECGEPITEIEEMLTPGTGPRHRICPTLKTWRDEAVRFARKVTSARNTGFTDGIEKAATTVEAIGLGYGGFRGIDVARSIRSLSMPPDAQSELRRFISDALRSEYEVTDQIIAEHLAQGYRGKIAIVRAIDRLDDGTIAVRIESRRLEGAPPPGFSGGTVLDLNVSEPIVEEFFRRYTNINRNHPASTCTTCAGSGTNCGACRGRGWVTPTTAGSNSLS